MIKLMVCVATALLLFGCAKEGEQEAAAGKDFTVSTLFEHNGCTVYRFFDAGHYVYFTDCTSTAHTQSCGRNCTRNVEIGGNKND